MQFEIMDFVIVVALGAIYIAATLIYNRFAKIEEE